MKIEVFTDGSATIKGLPGGWASVICIDDVPSKELFGHLESATNNDAELVAAIKGLEYIETFIINMDDKNLEYDVTLCSDSQLVLGWANGNYKFKQEDKMPLYDALKRLMHKLKAKTQWIEGHSGHVHNERCDKLANMARKGQTEEAKTIVKSLEDSKIGTKKNHVAALWYCGQLKIVDFEMGVIENYNRDVHGKRGSFIEIRENKDR